MWCAGTLIRCVYLGLCDFSKLHRNELFISDSGLTIHRMVGAFWTPRTASSRMVRLLRSSPSLSLIRSLGVAVTVLAITYGTIVCIDHLALQLAGFVCFSLFRMFLFSGMFAFVANTFGFGNFGRLSALCLVAGGTFSLLAIPLLQMVEYTLDGDFFYVNVAMCASSLPLVVFPCYLSWLTYGA